MAEENKVPETNKSPEANKAPEPNKTSTGLQQNVAGLLCYLLGWITGIIFLILEKDDKVVRFHAIQSIVVFGVLTVIMLIFSWIPFIGSIIVPIAAVVTFILWIVLMVKAYQGQMYKVPVAGNIAAQQTK
jgi:uncharacterized membrane protein